MEDRHPNFPAQTYSIITQQVILNPNDGYYTFRISVQGLDYFISCYIAEDKFYDIIIYEKSEAEEHITPRPIIKNILQDFFNFHINHYDYRIRLYKLYQELHSNCITVSNN